MPSGIETVRKAFAAIKGPAVLTTVDAGGNPNSIYATCVNFFDDGHFVVADNYFDKTRKNLKAGGKRGSVLFLDADGNAYQLKGALEYHDGGKFFDHMKTWNPTKHPGHAAAVLRIEEVWSGSEKIV